MDGNSPKPSETVDMQVSALRVLRTWFEREGGNQRIPLVLDLLAERTAANLSAGHPQPAFDADALRQLSIDAHGGKATDTAAARWLPSANVRRWWDQRRGRIEQACRDAEIDVAPELFIQAGGGRSNATLYRFDFQPCPALDEDPSESVPGTESQDPPGVIRYVMEPAQAVWWLTLIIGTEPFRMRSWRGLTFIGLVIAEALILGCLWLLIFLVLRRPHPVVSTDLLLLSVTTAFTFIWWRSVRPIFRLPIDRVTLASDFYLAWSQYDGQFRLTRDATSKVAGGWFRLVRHWGYCPICSGEVEIKSGGDAFPGRLVGRCNDSPLEHVFSFDPVSLAGTALRQQI